jgi:hypothetical protein
MFISKKHLQRRTFLRGVGATMALPLLDAMIPARTALAATAANPVPKMTFVYFPHGAIMSDWTPKTEGRGFELGQILEPLTPFKNQLTIVSGLENRHANGPVHSITPGTWLSGVSPRVSHDPWGGVTADQIAAQHISQDTPLPSIEVSVEETKSIGAGVCDRDYGCSYGGTISFRTPSTPLPMEFNPRKLFNKLFGQGDTAAERAELGAEFASILDLVANEATDLQKKLGPADRVMLSDYLETVREIERRVQKMEERDLSTLALPEVPVGIPNSFDEHINLMFDMTALAFQANTTRVATFMMAAEVSNQTYNHVGVPDAFHPVSHHQNNPQRIDKLIRIQNYHTKVLAKFLAKLKELPDGDGSMLDNSLVVYGSNMSNSNAHDHFPLPTALIGGGCGKLRGGQHLRYPDRTPVSNMFLTVLDRAGVPVESLGDSTGQFTEV